MPEPEDFSPSRLMESDDNSYYRSQIFRSEQEINPLVQSAVSLLSLARFLRDAEEPDDVPLLLQNLIHEVKAFEDKIKCFAYSNDTVISACYLLCAFLDEVILQNEWGANNNWAQDNLINFFYQDKEVDKKFFKIVDQLLDDAQANLDFLELAYLLLSLGYQGVYKNRVDGLKKLEQLNATIYDVVRSHRGEFSRSLIVKAKGSAKLKKLTSYKKSSRFSTRWVVVGVAILLLVGFYVGLNMHLHHMLMTSGLIGVAK